MTNFDKSTNHIDNKLKLMQDWSWGNYQYFMHTEGITYGVDKIHIRINNPKIIRKDYWIEKTQGTGYNINWSLCKAACKQTHPNIRQNIGGYFFTATIHLPYAPTINSNADYFDRLLILSIINNYLVAIGLAKVGMKDILINKMDIFIDYTLPEDISYQNIEKQHKAAINPAFNLRYHLNYISNTIYIVTLSKFKRGKEKFIPLLRIYNKSKQLNAKKLINHHPNEIARYEMVINEYRLKKNNDGQCTLTKWIHPLDLLESFYEEYTKIFLFKGQKQVDIFNALSGLNSTLEINDYVKAHLIQTLLNEGYSHAGIIEYLRKKTSMSDSTVLRWRKIYSKYSELLNQSTLRSTLVDFKVLLEDEIMKLSDK